MALAVVEYPVYAAAPHGAMAPPQNAHHNPSGFVTQSVDTTGTSTASAAFASDTRLVRLTPDVACYVAFGADPTATVESLRLNPNTQTYHAVTPGEKVAVITD